jgi:asparagine synthetase B (glutamine-hydrolysing)
VIYADYVQVFSLGQLNRSVTQAEVQCLTANSISVVQLESQLYDALKLRVLNIPSPSEHSSPKDSRLAILFSGGLDCTVLARISHDLLPIGQSIDLLNVGFENPRVVQAAKKLQKLDVAYPSMYEQCPDRITGRNAVRELREICPGREWRFVEVCCVLNSLRLADNFGGKCPLRRHHGS